MSFIQENILIVTNLVSGIVTGTIGLLAGRRKKEATNQQEENKVELGEIEIVKGIQETYNTFAKDMNEKYNVLSKELSDIKVENIEQRKSVRDLQKDNSNLHVEIRKLDKENTELKVMVTKLSLENKQLHQELTK